MQFEREQIMSWFTTDELSDCPRCGAHTLITTDISTVCFDCGVIEIVTTEE